MILAELIDAVHESVGDKFAIILKDACMPNELKRIDVKSAMQMFLFDIDRTMTTCNGTLINYENRGGDALLIDMVIRPFNFVTTFFKIHRCYQRYFKPDFLPGSLELFDTVDVLAMSKDVIWFDVEASAIKINLKELRGLWHPLSK